MTGSLIRSGIRYQDIKTVATRKNDHVKGGKIAAICKSRRVAPEEAKAGNIVYWTASKIAIRAHDSS